VYRFIVKKLRWLAKTER